MKDKEGLFPWVEKEWAIPILVNEVTPVGHDLKDLVRLTNRLRPLAVSDCRRSAPVTTE